MEGFGPVCFLKATQNRNGLTLVTSLWKIFKAYYIDITGVYF